MPQPPLPLFVECPHCGEVLELEQEFVHPCGRKCHTWTDGKGLGWILRNMCWSPHLEDDLYRGRECGKFFWLSKAIASEKRARRKAYKGAKYVNTGDVFEDLMTMRKNLAAHKVGRAADDRRELELALERGMGDRPPREIWIRLCILWLDNDPLRTVLSPFTTRVQIKTASVGLSAGFNENAGKLVRLLDSHDARERLLKAEILRQSGSFDEAVALLKDSATLFYETQEREVEETREYNEQFRSEISEEISDLRPRIESLILLARFILERALDRDQLVRPFQPRRMVFD